MKKYLVFFVLCFATFTSVGQIKDIGVPFIVNHSRSKYNASTQNWSITQSEKGFIYFGNNDGVIEFDGTNWRTFTVPNSSVVRSVLAVGDTIYVGAFEEIGYLAIDFEGKLAYNSLNHLIPSRYLNFDEIWNIYKVNELLVFQSFNYIFVLSNGEFKVIEPFSKFSFLHIVNDSFYVVDIENGLMLVEGDSLKLVSNNPFFFRNEIRCIIPFDNETLLLGASNEGLFLFDIKERKITPWNSDISKRVRENNLFSAIKLSNGNLAFGSVANGVYISAKDGRILQHMNRYKGLQNNTILSLFEDRKNNLWLGLDNGIDYLEVSSPLSTINYNFNIESAYVSIVHNGIMYVGTNQGLYAKEFTELSKLNSTDDRFVLVKGTEGQVWSLEVIDNTLFCGHNYGCFVVNRFLATQISSIRGFWSFLTPSNNNKIILAGTYTGLVRLHKNQEKWNVLDEVKGFNESSRSICFDKNGSLWVAHGYRGLFKLKLNNSYDSVVNSKLYRFGVGLPNELPYNIQVINDEVTVTAQTGIFNYSYANDSFYKPIDINKIFEGKGFIDKIYQDNKGNLWYFTDRYLGVMRFLEDGTYRDITSPFSSVNEILLPAFQNIYVYDSNNVFVGSQKGLIHYAPNIIKDYLVAERVFINEVSFYGKNKSSLPFFIGSNAGLNKEKRHVIHYSQNSVNIKFTLPAFENPDNINFSFRLDGFDISWSAWDKINFKEYTNLREGNYVFQIRAVNAFGAVSKIENFYFTIKPPFLRSKGAYVTYAILLILAIVGNFYYLRKRILKTRQREKLRHEKRLAQREKIFEEQTALSEKEIMHLRNEGLRSEMKHKNKELANATLHLIQKNKTLTYLKDDLSKLVKVIPSDKPEKQNINSLLKKINRDLRNEKGWELFNNYFDEVHQDFIERLRQKYSDLSPKELRLCAYLRMNISTKEIAPLMNISVRGVEISRYRLRKKLKLDYNTNLTDFIISF
jgi:ligand-binding sensor domain-containing protein/DNA-binding CsgD family transcriptional regulator